jgi:NitT/TauT family transport system substrate-binding protein
MTGGGRRWPGLRGSPLHVVVVLLTAVAYLGGCGSTPSGPQPAAMSLRLGVATLLAPPVPNSVLWLAKDDGFYQREGLDVSLLPLDGTPRVIAAMLAGDVDVGNVSTDQVLQLTASGRADLRALHSPDPRQFFLVASSARIDRVDGLRGRTLAISAIGGLDDTTTRLVLGTKGVAVSDLELIALGDPSARAAALVAGRVDATTISVGTWSTISAHAGVRVLVSPEEYFEAAPLVAKVDAVTAPTLATKRQQLQRFTRALLEAVRWYAQHRQAWIEAMVRRRPELDRSMLSALWDGFSGTWAVDGGMEPAQLQTTAGILYGSAELRGLPHVPVSRWTDLRDLDAALQQLRRM